MPLNIPVVLFNTSTSSASLVTPAGTTTGGTGSVMYVLGAIATGSVPGTVSDSKGNTWTLVTSGSRGVGATYYLWRCVAGTGGSGHTFTLASAGANLCTIIAFEVTGCHPTNPVNATSVFAADSTVPYQQTVTSTANNTMTLVFNSSDTAGYTFPFNEILRFVTASTWSLSTARASTPRAGLKTVTVNSAGSTDFIIAMEVLEEAPAQTATLAWHTA